MKKYHLFIIFVLFPALASISNPDKRQVGQTIRAKAMANIVETVSSSCLKKGEDSTSYLLNEPNFHLTVWKEKDALGRNYTVFVVNCE